MNIRQKKKRRMKYIAMNDYPAEPFSEYQCPYCGWDSEQAVGDSEELKNGTVQMTNYHSFFDGHYSGHSWTENYKCPICGVKFEFDNSDI